MERKSLRQLASEAVRQASTLKPVEEEAAARALIEEPVPHPIDEIPVELREM